MRPEVVAQASEVADEVGNSACVKNKVLSVTSDSGIYVTGILNHSVTCILLDTGAVSVLNEETWRKSGLVSKLEPVTGTLTTANGNKLTVLGETKVRFRLGNIDCFWQVMIARGLSHDCILGSVFFFSTLNVKSTVTLEPSYLELLKFQSGTARLHLVFVEFFCVMICKLKLKPNK